MNDASTQITGERIARSVAEGAAAEQLLSETEGHPRIFLDALSALMFAISASIAVGYFGTRLEAILGALAGAAFSLSLASYRNGVLQHKRIEAVLCVVRQAAPQRNDA